MVTSRKKHLRQLVQAVETLTPAERRAIVDLLYSVDDHGITLNELGLAITDGYPEGGEKHEGADR